LFKIDEPAAVDLTIISKPYSDITMNPIKIKGIHNLLKLAIEGLWDENIKVFDEKRNFLSPDILWVYNNIQFTHIEKTLKIVAEKWETSDVNGDGKINCIDAALLFYMYYPDKDYVRIIGNNNEINDFHHLFNAVLINGFWWGIEPQTYAYEEGSYWMKDAWEDIYDYSFNSDFTDYFLQYLPKNH